MMFQFVDWVNQGSRDLTQVCRPLKTGGSDIPAQHENVKLQLKEETLMSMELINAQWMNLWNTRKRNNSRNVSHI